MCCGKDYLSITTTRDYGSLSHHRRDTLGVGTVDRETSHLLKESFGTRARAGRTLEHPVPEHREREDHPEDHPGHHRRFEGTEAALTDLLLDDRLELFEKRT